MNFSQAPYIEDLVHWISEREQVRIKKEAGLPKPWSNDPILQTTRFCNIRREDDKVTRWIKDNWRDPYAEHPNLAFAMCLARIVNWPDTLGALGFPVLWDSHEFVQRMDSLSASGAKVWTGAYMITGGYSSGGETKQQIMARVLDKAFSNSQFIRKGDTLAQSQYKLEQTPGMGTFLCAQVIADLKYTPLLPCSTSDWETHCSPGPGSTMGLNFLHGREPTKSLGAKQFSEEVNALRVWLGREHFVDLTAHDTQNCLCEFSKYVRIKYLKNRPKSGYPGR